MAKELDLSGFDEETAGESQGHPKVRPSESSGIDLSGFDDELSKHEMNSVEQPGMGEAILRGAGQGLTFGFEDELAGGLKAAKDKYYDGSTSDLESLYKQYRDLERQKNEAASAAHPWASGISEVAGSIPTAFIPGLGASTLARAAALGGSYALGKSNADLTEGDVLGATKDVATGGALGAVGYKVAPLIGAAFKKTGIPGLFSKAGQGLKTESNDMALSVFGPKAKDIKKERGLSLFSEEGHRKGIGQEAANNLKFAGGPEGARESVRLQLQDLARQKDELLSNINNQLQSKINPNSATIEGLNAVKENSLGNTLSRYREEVVQNIRRTNPLGKDLETKVSENLDDYITRIQGNDEDLLKLDALRSEIGEKLGNSAFAKDEAGNLNEQILKKIYFTLKNRIEELSSVVDPRLGEMVKHLNMKQSNLLDLGRITFNTEAGQAAKGSGWALGDVMAMGAGGSVAGLPGSIAALGLKKGVEKMTGFDATQLARIGGSKILSGASKIPTAISNTNISQPMLRSAAETMKPLEMSQKAYSASPEELSGAAQKLMTNPQFANYGKALQEALANKDPEKKNAIIFTILQNPNMRSFLNEQ